MADVKMPKSVPCQFDKGGWAPCKKPSTNGWCSEHEKAKCVSCGEQAHKPCDAQMGGLGCGAMLCKTCEHGPDGKHITRAVAEKLRRTEVDEEAATRASRTSKTQRMNAELGVPLNLFEHLKGDRAGSEIMEYYFLQLEHGLMGFFPAIFDGTKRIIITTDLALIERVWRMMEPRESKVTKNLGHVLAAKGVVYPILGDTQYDRETSKPQQLLTEAELDELLKKTKKPFKWAFGLIGGRDPSKQQFEEMIERGIAQYRVPAGAGT